MRILVLEDDRRIANILSQALSEEGHAVQLCHRGDEGLALLTSNRYGMALLDIMLPGMDGFAVLDQLRERQNETPVLVLTACNSAADMVRGLDLGADDYLAKPFQLDVLLARVRAVSRRGQRAVDDDLVFGSLVLHRPQRLLRREGRSIPLTKKEFLLLEVLMRRADRVVTREELIRVGWNQSVEVSDNSIDFYISSLRSKLDTEGRPSRIRTLRALGYCFSGDDVA